MHSSILTLLSLQSLVAASPIAPLSLSRRTVTELNQAAFDEAQQPDNTATKAISGTQIKTSDGRCLFVDELSGDFRANLTPIQVAECDSTDGQGWDVITAGKHNNVQGSALIVSTLTNACFNFDPRRASGNQVILFSCGGRADGGGEVTDSQLFPFTSSAGAITFTPENDLQSCFTVKGNVVDVAPCAAGNANQQFTFGDAAASAGGSQTTTQVSGTLIATATSQSLSKASTTSASQTASSPAVTTNVAVGGIPNPTESVPVSRAGGILQPTAVAEAQARDNTATRAFTSVSIKAPNGQCLFIDPTAGDFRENLIPVSLVDCAGTPNEKFDVITAGKHNNAQGSALIVSSLTNGCMSFDGRRPAGDTVTLFSCGGRADGGGDTNNGQLVPFTGGISLVFAPESERNATCIVAGNGRLDSAPCANDGSQAFTILA
ncbi:uncharacterized protein GGS22DRAFT_79633 [Annulohypoxylon maeteangense]|uniref:uncharacterized protein n=1 Tax=Annulohypoxylon maeteangense TaxID=1927788 RepID=UPI002007D3F0|nr:uncharacterized protein GGS22DRAFT_79633 [Annulohypoxylon maeteangense]KAI0880750.1 hypothetical protein GGS22DRAFT_79633 [Annulohypoxylon maeteangense]